MISLNEWIQGLTFLKKALLAFLLGLMVAAALPPVHLVFLLPVSFTGLILILSGAKNRKQAFFVGWWFAWGQFIAGLYWIGVAFTIDADAHAALMPLPVLALPAFLAIFPGLATLATHMTKVESVGRIFIFTSFWILSEYVRGTIFTGFPWNLVGYSWTFFLPVLQSTAYIGIYGLTLLTVLVSCLPALLADRHIPKSTAIRFIATGGMVFILIFVAGQWRLNEQTTDVYSEKKIRIIQPNIRQADKWKPHLRRNHLLKTITLSQTENGFHPDYLIWPETAVPYFLTTSDQLKAQLTEFVPQGGAIVTGAPRHNPETNQYWNSVHVLDGDGQIKQTYDKQHLVPYGEYLPLRNWLKATGLMKLIPVLDQMSDFAIPEAGAPKVISLSGLPPARVMICYEIAFPWEVVPNTQFSWILNATNDGWFGNTSGPYQHLAITITRAVEHGKPVIRAANTGISAIIDPYGNIVQKLDLNETGIIDGYIPMPTETITFYGNVGEIVPAIMTLILFIIGVYYGRFRSRYKNTSFLD
ncbi:apolipoprotein N-acyltransferase [Sneathiella marina]|uniref:Apolipoprotein N-acyltransferase n=1 Tax=Sneathiella marina TaxID=2950108 RepID=A0ABY4W201_9PROT|nr:apolipoprotein N-acyltransferase [Sneathiella marina]USG61212.1 apolipoprotein N-acyltransferase [Sneathiella marina]